MTIGKKIKSKYGDLILRIYSYESNKRLAILLYNEDGELFDDLTINIPYYYPNIDEGFINDFINSSDFDIVKLLKKDGVIESLGFKDYNMGKYEYVRFNFDKLVEYDSEGFNKYITQLEG